MSVLKPMEEVFFQPSVDWESGGFYETACDFLWWLLPEHTKTSRFLSDLNRLEASCQEALVFSTTLVGKAYLREVLHVVSNANRPVVVIPLVLDSVGINHAVVLIVDTKRGQLVYYDPKGGNPIDDFRRPQRLFVKDNVPCSLLVLFSAIQRSTQFDLLYSPQTEQSTLTHPLSCGLFCARFIEKYILYRETVLLKLCCSY